MSPPANPAAAQDPARWRILTVLLAAQFMTLIGISIVNVVLPSIQEGISASDTDLQWVLAGYSLTFGVLLVPAGRAGDLLGRKKLFLVGLIIFALASLAAGVAPDPNSLNIARLVQGIGSGLVNPQVMGLMQQYFRGKELGTAYGLFGTVAGVSVAIGPLLGGVLVALLGADFGWRFTFLLNVPIAVITIACAVLWIPQDRPVAVGDAQLGEARSTAKPRAQSRDFDPLGTLLFVLTVSSPLLAFVLGREYPVAWWGAALCPILLLGWVWWEKRYTARGKTPMLDLTLFRIASFARGNAIGGLYYLGITSLWVLVAVYAQQGQGFTALEAGLLGLPSALCAALSSYWAGRLVARHGSTIVRFGLVVALAGLCATVVLLLLHEHFGVNLWWLLLTLACMGIAQGAIISPNQTLTMSEVPVDRAGSAGGMTQTFQRVGTAVGIAAITAVFYGALGEVGWNLAMVIALSVIAGVVLVTLAVELVSRKK